MEKRRAVFLDRDGVLIKAIVYNGAPRPPHSVEEFTKLSGLHNFTSVLHSLREKGFLIIMITNQPDIVYKNITQEDWNVIQETVTMTFQFDDVYICFHGRDEGCSCKKPQPGMLFDAAQKWNIDLDNSYIVGDTKSDMGAGRSAGVHTVLIEREYNKDIESEFRINKLEELEAIIW